MDERQSQHTGNKGADTDSLIVKPTSSLQPDQKDKAKDTHTSENEANKIVDAHKKNRWEELRGAGVDRHIELGLTCAIVFFSLVQLLVTWSNNSSTSKQSERLLDSANRINDAADSFSRSSADMSGSMGNAVKQLEAQAKGIEASRTTSESNSKQALDNTVRQSNLDERAWAGFRNLTFVINKTDPLKVQIRVAILGKSPAVDIVVKQGIRFFPPTYIIQVSDLSPDPIGIHQGTAFPNTEFPIQVNGENPISPKERFFIDGVLDKTYSLYYFGVIAYNDIFRKPHWTRFCDVIPSTDADEIHPCPMYNDSDADYEKN
jgi:hypothetical protein